MAAKLVEPRRAQTAGPLPAQTAGPLPAQACFGNRCLPWAQARRAARQADDWLSLLPAASSEAAANRSCEWGYAGRRINPLLQRLTCGASLELLSRNESDDGEVFDLRLASRDLDALDANALSFIEPATITNVSAAEAQLLRGRWTGVSSPEIDGRALSSRVSTMLLLRPLVCLPRASLSECVPAVLVILCERMLARHTPGL